MNRKILEEVEHEFNELLMDYQTRMVINGLIEDALNKAKEEELRHREALEKYSYISDDVDIIASGYEWECPICGSFHKKIEIHTPLICHDCKHLFNNLSCHEAWE